MDAWAVGFLSLAEVEALLRRVFGCWPDERRDSCWVAAYRRASNVVERWEQEIRAELAAQGAMMEADDGGGGALPTQSSTRKERKEGAACVGAGHHASTGDSLVDDICAVHLAAVDAMLQDARAKGRGKEGNSP